MAGSTRSDDSAEFIQEASGSEELIFPNTVGGRVLVIIFYLNKSIIKTTLLHEATVASSSDKGKMCEL